MSGYIRQDSGDNISNGSVIDADYLDQEFDAIEGAFASSGGHKHDGTTGEGAPITKIGPVQDFVASSTSFSPKTDSSHTLGSDALRFSNIFADGVTIGDGDLSWNASDLTLDLVLASTGVTLQLGQEQLIRVQNNTGSTIANGTVVKYASAIGASGYFRVEPMTASPGVNRKLLLGVTTQDIPNGGVGFVTSQGFVRNINTSSWAAGTILWVSPTLAGGLTPTEPTSPNTKLPIAVVTTSHATNGVLYVRTAFSGSRLSDDDMVHLTSLSNNDLLVYNSSTSRFENKRTLSGLTLTSSVAALTAGSTFTGGTISSSTLSSNTITGGTASGVAITGGTISSTTVSGSTLSGNTITGGTVSGLSSDLAIADGGTGASTASAALTNLGVSAFAKTLLDDTSQTQAQTTLGIINSLIPIGAILPCATNTFPSSFVLCAGQEVSRTTYSALFGLIGTIYGSGDGSTTFNVPDLRDRVPLGRDGMSGSQSNRITHTNTDNLGDTGGSGTHTLTNHEMPNHRHYNNFTSGPGGIHSHNIQMSASGADNPGGGNGAPATDGTQLTGPFISGSMFATDSGNHDHAIQGHTDYQGGSGPHNNMQPYIALNYIMRAM